jgi:hypothetical protein
MNECEVVLGSFNPSLPSQHSYNPPLSFEALLEPSQEMKEMDLELWAKDLTERILSHKLNDPTLFSADLPA